LVAEAGFEPTTSGL